jgi:heat shock protein HslJ
MSRRRDGISDPLLRVAAVAIVPVLLLVVACTTPPRAGPAGTSGGNTSLAGTHWSLQGLGTDAAPRTPTVTLDFGSDGRISGNDGCNQYQGAYATDGSSIEMARDLAGTLMACPDPIEARARAYREALQRAARFTVDDRTLSLNGGTGRLLATFVPSGNSPVRINWEVIAYNNGKQGVVSLLAGTRVNARFGDDGQVTGTAGCNQYSATYQLDGEAMSIGMAAATRMFCNEPEGLMQQEALYLAALKSTATFRLDGDKLELRAADGALAVTLNRSAAK